MNPGKTDMNADTVSNRKFGILVGSLFLLLALYHLFFKDQFVPVWFVLSAVLIIPAFLLPALLTPIHTGWMKLAGWMGIINTWLILFLLYYLVLTPIGRFRALFGRALRKQKAAGQAISYWEKSSVGEGSSVKTQF
ncbi:hypothetical protein ACSBL2_13335 [Pedobacter sp. AW31-3R]|uniref:hypothetical protein n=1 Tax=Pedobacter sp. AW31-3R TaxID=3445781 RepID=UPI003F9FC597